MVTKRALTLAVLLVLSGCTGAMSGGSFTFSASDAYVEESTLSSTPWEVRSESSPSFEHDFEVQGQSVHVELNAHVTYYGADYQNAPLGFAGVLSTPTASVAGQQLNPLGEVGYDTLIERALSRSDQFGETREVERHEMTVLGRETEVVEYASTAESEGRTHDVRILVTRVEHEGDYVVVAGVYPTALEGGREATMDLFRNVVHETDSE